jgi:hypothetical protein
LQRWQVVLDHVPHDVKGDAEVVVDDAVAHARDVFPWDGGMGLASVPTPSWPPLR